jgi:hypothetical protein
MRTSVLLLLPLLLLLAAVLSVPPAGAQDSFNPNSTSSDPRPLPQSINAQALTLYTDLALWRAAAGPNRTLIDFDQFASGTLMTTQLLPYCITRVSGTSVNENPPGATTQYVTSSADLPFPMFQAGTLPTEPNFLSNLLGNPVNATGTITFDMGAPTTAIGAFVADAGPLGTFHIEAIAGQQSLGTVTSPPRALPNSFIGVVSPDPFDRATFYADSPGDSWGLDNLEHNCLGATPVAPTTWGRIKGQYR